MSTQSDFYFERRKKTKRNFTFIVKNRIKYRNKCVLYVQKIVRGFLARKQHQPRYRGIINIKSVKEKLHRSTDIVNQLRGNKDIVFKEAADVEHLINASVRNIQNNARITPKQIDKMYSDIVTKIDNYNNLLKTELQVLFILVYSLMKIQIHNIDLLCPQKQRQAEEQERLRKIQEALETERRQKEEEERKSREEEENRKK